NLGLALADRKEAAAEPALPRHAPGEKKPDREEDDRRRDEGKDVAEEGALDDAGVGHVVLRELLCEIGIDPRGHEARALVGLRLLVGALDDVVGDRDFLDAAGLELL